MNGTIDDYSWPLIRLRARQPRYSFGLDIDINSQNYTVCETVGLNAGKDDRDDLLRERE